MAKPTRTNLTEPGSSRFLKGDQVAGPGITLTVGAHEEQPPVAAQPGAQLGAQTGSQAGAQIGVGCAFSPRNKHDSQPITGANKTAIAVTVNSLRIIYSLSNRLALSRDIFNMKTLHQD